MTTTIGKRLIAATAATIVAFGFATSAQASNTDSDDVRKVSRYDSQSDSQGKPLEGVHVAIDPGHAGGNRENRRLITTRISDGRGGFATCDSIGRRAKDGYQEHAFTFTLAQELAEKVEELGGTFALTRTDNDGVGPCLDVRGRFAEDVQADVLISLHATNTYSAQTSGFAVEVSDPPLSPSQTIARNNLAIQLANAIARLEAIEAQEDTTLGVRRTDNDPVLNFARRPAVSIEVGNLRNDAEYELMKSQEFREQLVEAITSGLVSWQDSMEQGPMY